MSKIRVFLVEDHTIVRRGLRKLLEGDPGIEVVGEVADGRAAVDAAPRLEPDVAVVDVSLPSLNGIEVTRQLTKLSPRTKVLVLSMHADAAYVRKSLSAGAKGYLLKDADHADLQKAIEAVHRGEAYFSPAVSSVVLQGYLNEGSGPTDELSLLSNREREVLQLIAEGKSNKELAQILGISVSTAESHRKRLMDKLDLHNTAELVGFAFRKGMIE